jgi:hypothetical protein
MINSKSVFFCKKQKYLLCDGCEEYVLGFISFFIGICVMYSAKSEFVIVILVFGFSCGMWVRLADDILEL